MPHDLSVRELRASFDAATAYTVGIEDEVMLLDPDTLELATRAGDVLAKLDGDPQFKLELPASQLEILGPPGPRVADAATAVLNGRRKLADATSGLVRLASAGVHPFSSGTGKLNRGPRYDRTVHEYGALARRQLVCALQVHVAVGDGDRALATYNAARSFLPLLAALAANAPFYEGDDTGLASVRPKLAELLPRQGVPPRLDGWETYASALRWGARVGPFPDAGAWWWELRPHPRYGTLEFRVPDGQTTVADAAAIAAAAQALVAWLDSRLAAGEELAVAPSWRIAENRWSACRHGVEGTMADLQSGEQRPTRIWLTELLDTLEPVARGLGAGNELDHARAMVEVNPAMAQRRVAAAEGMTGLARWLAARFREPPGG
jgi:carboxylate-amine ligase